MGWMKIDHRRKENDALQCEVLSERKESKQSLQHIENISRPETENKRPPLPLPSEQLEYFPREVTNDKLPFIPKEEVVTHKDVEDGALCMESSSFFRKAGLIYRRDRD